MPTKTINIYTDFPQYGVNIWNQTTQRLLNEYYNTHIISSVDSKYFNSIKTDLFIFSTKTIESCKEEIQNCILNDIPYILIAHLVPNEYVKLCENKEWVKVALNGAEQVIAVSKSTLKNLHKLGLLENKGTVIYPCVNDAFYTSYSKTALILRELFEIPIEAKIFLTVARIDKVKGYNLQLDVINKLKTQNNELYNKIHWVWVGNGPEYWTLDSILQETGLNTNIHMTNEIDHNLLPEIYAGAEAFILPSYHEGTPTALLEAIAAGLPIAATKVDGIDEVLNFNNAIMLPDPIKDDKWTRRELMAAYDILANEHIITGHIQREMFKERYKYTESRFTDNLLKVITPIMDKIK